MLTSPISGAHAISEVAFSIQLTSEFGATAVEGLLLLKEQLKDELPAMQAIQAFTAGIVIGPDSKPSSTASQTRLGGAIFEAAKPDGTPAWILKAQDKRIVVNCLAYSRWDDVWSRAKKYLKLATKIVLSTDNPVVQVGLEYVDRFIRDKLPGYSPTEVFNPKSKYLAPNILDAGEAWHLFQGWFEDPNGLQADRYLNVLNVNATVAEDKHVTMIHHIQQLQLADTQIGDFNRFEDRIEGFMEHLHKRNKSVLRELLNNDMQVRINLA